MWALRRASIPLRTRGFNVRASRVKLAGTSCVEEESITNDYGGFLLSKTLFHLGHNASLNLTVGKRALSSNSTKEDDDLEDGFSELDESDGNESDDLLTSNEVNEAAKEGRKLRCHGRAKSDLSNEVKPSCVNDTLSIFPTPLSSLFSYSTFSMLNKIESSTNYSSDSDYDEIQVKPSSVNDTLSSFPMPLASLFSSSTPSKGKSSTDSSDHDEIQVKPSCVNDTLSIFPTPLSSLFSYSTFSMLNKIESSTNYSSDSNYDEIQVKPSSVNDTLSSFPMPLSSLFSSSTLSKGESSTDSSDHDEIQVKFSRVNEKNVD